MAIHRLAYLWSLMVSPIVPARQIAMATMRPSMLASLFTFIAYSRLSAGARGETDALGARTRRCDGRRIGGLEDWKVRPGILQSSSPSQPTSHKPHPLPPH